MRDACERVLFVSSRLLMDCQSMVLHVATPVATRQLRLPLQCCNLWCCTQDGGTTETLLVADSVKHVVQHIEAAERLDNRQPVQPPGCIIISDSEEEADVSGHAAAVAPPSTSSPLFMDLSEA